MSHWADWLASDRRIVKLYTLDAQTGETKSVGGVDSNCYRGLQLNNGGRYCESLVYDALTGQPVSGGNFGANDYLWLPPIISNVAILGSNGYTIADDATLRAFDVATGTEVGFWQAPYVADWRKGIWVYVIIPGLASDGERLYVSAACSCQIAPRRLWSR